MSRYSDNFAAAGITSMDQVEENLRMILWIEFDNPIVFRSPYLASIN